MTHTRVGFIGAGIIANRHMGNLLGFPDVSVVAVADVDIERARALAERCGGRAYDSHTEMLEGEHLDALYICIPPFAHGSPELDAAEYQIPFFVQKPVAADLDTAETIARAVEASGLVTAVGYHWRYIDVVERAQELLARNPARLALGYWLDFTPPPGWWVKETLSGGQLVEQMTHVFDLARLLVGEVGRVYAARARVERPAFAHADMHEVSAATLHFVSGALGTIASTCILNWPHRIGLHLFCEGMVIELSEFDIMVDVGQGRPVQPAEGDPFIKQDRDFLDAVQGHRSRIRVPYAEALKTHRLVAATVQAAREERVLDLRPETAYV